ncbi:hypothetical protein BH09ACT12_BH09ACT12_10550 [soil metagenome]
MHRTTTRSLVATALLALLAPLALTFAAPAAQATAAPELRLFTLPGPGNPLKVDGFDPAAPPTATTVALNVFTDETVDDVTVTVIEHRGLYVDPLVTTFDTIEGNRAELVRYAVAASTTGLHTLTFEVTAPGVEARRVSLPYVWAAGGAPIPGDDSLQGRMYAYSGLGTFDCPTEPDTDYECRTYRHSERMAFLDDTRASTALALDGTPRCAPKRRCASYHHDRFSGLVQVGNQTIGRVTNSAAFIGGVRYVRLVYPRPGQRLDGLWLYGAHVDEGRGVVEQRLRLKQNGHFRLDYFVDTTRVTPYGEPERGSAYARSLTGTYAIGRNGRIAFNDPRRGTKVATLAVVATPQGAPRAGSKGLWLDQSFNPPKGRSFVDGNRLQPLG